jgi:hypothetical protein
MNSIRKVTRKVRKIKPSVRKMTRKSGETASPGGDLTIQLCESSLFQNGVEHRNPGLRFLVFACAAPSDDRSLKCLRSKKSNLLGTTFPIES